LLGPARVDATLAAWFSGVNALPFPASNPQKPSTAACGFAKFHLWV
jgi:hypothetical protein